VKGSFRNCSSPALGKGPVTGLFEGVNEPSYSIKAGAFLDEMSDYRLLKEDFAECS
jgi:hypothetical protein